MVARVGMVFLVIGVLLIAVLPGSVVHLVGLGLWWFGVLLIADVLLGRDGLPAQFLWMAGTTAGVYAIGFHRTGLLRVATAGPGLVVVVVVTVLLGGIALRRPRRRAGPMASVIGGLRDRAAAAARAARPRSAAAATQEVGRLLTVIAGHLDAARSDRPREAAQMSDLLHRYRSRHGFDLISTSPQPEALRTAVTALAADMEAIRAHVPASAAGYPHITLAAAYARSVSAIVLDDRTR